MQHGDSKTSLSAGWHMLAAAQSGKRSHDLVAWQQSQANYYHLLSARIFNAVNDEPDMGGKDPHVPAVWSQ